MNRDRKNGSAQESVKPHEFGWFGSFVKFGPRSRRRCGNVKTRVLCGFSNSEGGAQTLQSESPHSALGGHFHSETLDFQAFWRDCIPWTAIPRKMWSFKKPPKMRVSPNCCAEP